MNFDSSLPVWVAGVVIVAYQGIYRCFLRRPRKQRLIFMLKRSAVSLFCYAAAVASLWNSNLPSAGIALLSAVAGLGVAQFVVRRTPRFRVKGSVGVKKASQLRAEGDSGDFTASRAEQFAATFPTRLRKPVS
jgi:hypothetical protein